MIRSFWKTHCEGWFGSSELAAELDEAPMLRADPDRLTQVFVNLLRNAVGDVGELAASMRRRRAWVGLRARVTG